MVWFAVIWYEKATPQVPLAVPELVIVGGGGLLIVKVTSLVPVPLLLVAVRRTVYEPAVIGVPVITPVGEGPVRPGGSPVAGGRRLAPQLPLGIA
jgi:hypothetical protein